MSLPVSEARVLTRIEAGLTSRDPRLRSLFAIFTRLTWQEAMPAREQLRRRRRLPSLGAVVLVAVALAVVGIVVVSLAMPGRACTPAPGHQTAIGTFVGSCAPATSSRSPLP